MPLECVERRDRARCRPSRADLSSMARSSDGDPAERRPAVTRIRCRGRSEPPRAWDPAPGRGSPRPSPRGAPRRAHEPRTAPIISVSASAAERGAEAGIDLQGALAWRRPSSTPSREPARSVPTLEVFDVSFRIHRAALGEARRLAGGAGRRSPARRSRQFTLEVEHVLGARDRSGRPDRVVGSGGDQLHAEAHAIAHEQRRAFQYRVDIELACDLRQGLRGALVLMADVREITRNALMSDRSEMIASVMPSAKYSCAGSPEPLRRGRTAMARMTLARGQR